MEQTNDSEGLEHYSNMAEELTDYYYGTSTHLRESGIIPALKGLGCEDTTWVIHFMQRHLEELTFKRDTETSDSFLNPIAVLDQLGDMIRATGKTSAQLIEERLHDKYAL